MRTPVEKVKSTEQLTLDPPLAVELSLRIGLVPSEGRGQIQLEVLSATDRTWLELSSKPSFDLCELDEVLRVWCDAVKDAAFRHSCPF